MKKQINPNIQAHLLRATFYVLMLVAVCAIPFALAQRNISKPGAATGLSQRILSFEERVAYQRAIEEVYWRHRIWPNQRPDPKPSLDAVMSQAQLERKVADYLRNSQALEDYWQRPITAEQLQTEMERMAQHTRQPDLLRELFEALGNDPFVVAECLARPVLTERLIADVSAQDQTGRLASLRTAELRTMSVVTMSGQFAYTLPVIGNPSGSCIDNWVATSTTNAPTARAGHTAVWTGSEMIVWGGAVDNTGGRYNPSTDTWTATSTTNAPTARGGHTAVWTGSEMIVWGGSGVSGQVNSGGRYNPSTDSWTATITTSAPAARAGHTAVWTGSEMIVWGGCTGIHCNPVLSSGGRYNPSTDSWTATGTTNAPAARAGHTAVWTGSEMIVWGSSFDSSGGRYNPSTDSWTATSTTNAPEHRSGHRAVWTGSDMIVWGGAYVSGIVVYLNTGGRYDPSSDSWVATSTTNAPAPRDFHTGVWTDSEMIIWGGHAPSSGNASNTGGRYNPSTDSWTATNTINAPVAREFHTAVWTDSGMIVWGGEDENFAVLNSGGRYCAPCMGRCSPTPRPRPTPAPRPTL